MRISSLFLAAVLMATAAGCGGTHAANGVLRVYLARHGQTDWNAERRLQGQTDIPLNDTGRAQAQKLRLRLDGIVLDRVYSSALARSRETAQIVRSPAPLESLSGLSEQRIGKFEGLRLAVDSAGTTEFEQRSQDPDDTLDGGESERQFFTRVADTVRDILNRHPRGGAILIVAHGGTNRMILRALLDLSREQAETVRQANDELYLLEIDADKPPRTWKAIGIENLGDL